MSDGLNITVNDAAFRVALKGFTDRINRRALLTIAGAVMRGSIEQTFRDQGSPAGSWAPLKAWTRPGAGNRISFSGNKIGLTAEESKDIRRFVKRGRTTELSGWLRHGGGFGGAREALRPGRQILIKSGRLKNSITYQVGADRLIIGSDLKYARIHQMGGRAGRKHAAKIPARPYLVFRPEDPARMQEAMESYIQASANAAGLGK